MIDIFIYIFLFILGSVLGSFFSVVIDRLIRDEKFFVGRSYCESCHKKLKILDLIPIISFLYLSGRCRYCKKQIPISLFLTEIATGILFVVLFLIFNYLLISLAGLFILTLFSITWMILISDLKYNLIPSYFLYSLCILFILYLVYFYFFPFSNIYIVNIFFKSNILEKFIALFGFYALFYLIKLFAKKNVIGEGDIYLFCILGFYLGIKLSIVMWFISFLTGSFVGVILVILNGKNLKSKIAFAPYIILGFYLAIMVGDDLVDWYTKFL